MLLQKNNTFLWCYSFKYKMFWEYGVILTVPGLCCTNWAGKFLGTIPFYIMQLYISEKPVFSVR